MSFTDCWKNNWTCPKKWKDLPDIDTMLVNGDAIKITTSDVQQKVKQQFGNNVEFSKFGKCRILLPSYALRKFIELSKLDKNVYSSSTGYICGDFSLGFYSEINLSPYWETVVGMVTVPGHRLNIAWCSDWQDMFFIEPQNDKMYAPDKEVTQIQF
jgi:hypothetical protein|tara:strand:- start:223 stop:690 length:468 start_codon:yes stop_codon:yes gene_type:complete